MSELEDVLSFIASTERRFACAARTESGSLDRRVRLEIQAALLRTLWAEFNRGDHRGAAARVAMGWSPGPHTAVTPISVEPAARARDKGGMGNQEAKGPVKIEAWEDSERRLHRTERGAQIADADRELSVAVNALNNSLQASFAEPGEGLAMNVTDVVGWLSDSGGASLLKAVLTAWERREALNPPRPF